MLCRAYPGQTCNESATALVITTNTPGYFPSIAVAENVEGNVVVWIETVGVYGAGANQSDVIINVFLTRTGTSPRRWEYGCTSRRTAVTFTEVSSGGNGQPVLHLCNARSGGALVLAHEHSF